MVQSWQSNTKSITSYMLLHFITRLPFNCITSYK